MSIQKDILQTEIKFLKGVGPKRAELLNSELGIRTFEDLLYYFPFRYIDKSKITTIKEIKSDSVWVQLKGKIIKGEVIGTGSAKRYVATFIDKSGSIEILWFKGIKWVDGKFDPKTEYLLYGKPNFFNNKFNITHPEIEELKSNEIVGSDFQSVYSSTDKLTNFGLSSKGFSKIIRTLIEQESQCIYENLTTDILTKYNLVSRSIALCQIHFPENHALLQKSINRLKFEELFFIQLELIKSKLFRKINTSGFIFEKIGSKFNTFYKEILPFELTNAQKKVIREIRQDFGSGKQMNRLLQGDVGSGKTLVALMCILIALDNGFQTCIMAPTEILAKQHFITISRFLESLSIKVELLTGNVKGKKRTEILSNTKDGNVNILIGTHALIEDNVVFQNLGLVVIDEQHRFGVEQRAKLWKKNTNPPHVLVMTATPIPRTMAMTLYGDLDYSVIDELPPGRKQVKTLIYYDNNRHAIYEFIKKQIELGRQIYIVYPLISESETLDLKNLFDGYENIIRIFPLPYYKVSILHGKMKPEDKEFEMNRFVKGETQILVSTTVIEVGVDVPNASVMIIENAERFGLSQLHQLRGRVGRGAEQSYCLLMSSFKKSKEATIRLETMVKTNDGFEIADVDLKLRGPGDLKGTQQSGILDLKIADLIRDEKIIKAARKEAITIIESDPYLQNENHLILSYHIRKLESKTTNWSRIS